MVNERLHRVLERQNPRLSIEQGEVDHAERRLHLRVVIELVEDHVLDGVALQFQHDPHTISVALVSEVRDALDLLRLDEQGDRFDEGRFTDHVRDFRNDDPGAVVACLFELRLRTNPDQSTPGPVRIRYAIRSVQDAAGGKVRAANRTRLRVVQVDQLGLRVVNQDD